MVYLTGEVQGSVTASFGQMCEFNCQLEVWDDRF